MVNCKPTGEESAKLLATRRRQPTETSRVAQTTPLVSPLPRHFCSPSLKKLGNFLKAPFDDSYQAQATNREYEAAYNLSSLDRGHFGADIVLLCCVRSRARARFVWRPSPIGLVRA